MDPQNNQNQGGNNAQNNAPKMSSPNNNTVLAVLAYLGPLVVVSYLMAGNDQYVKFHAKQGLVVFILEVLIWILSGTMWSLYMIWSLLNLCTLILSIIGIVNAVQGQQKDLPVVGGFAKNLNF